VVTAIEADLRSWSREVLEAPSPHLGGMPPCPYARKAWRENKVLVIESDNFEEDVASIAVNFTSSVRNSSSSAHTTSPT
jgi:hypothetical protein